MFDEEAVRAARVMYQEGSTPAEILRHFATRRPSESVPDLMQLLRDAFSLPFDAVTCIGGWWHDGTGELSDRQINDFIQPAIQKHWNGK